MERARLVQIAKLHKEVYVDVRGMSTLARAALCTYISTVDAAGGLRRLRLRWLLGDVATMPEHVAGACLAPRRL